MNNVLNRDYFFVKEHVGMFKAANNYDVLDPESKEIIMTCREDNLGALTKLLRFTKYKRMTPFHVEIKTASGEKVLTVKRGISIFLSTVEVFDENNCVAQDVIIIDEPPVLNVSITTSDWNNYQIQCHGDNSGTADFAIIGGAAPYLKATISSNSDTLI